MSRSDLFFTKTGWLTPYAMACGYQHRTDIGQPYQMDLTFECVNPEIGLYDINGWIKGERVWATIEGIANGRALYRKLAGKALMRRARKTYEPLTMPAEVYA